ncbi:MAG: GSCFA domain-containing protein [Saprospiraceae bacterium]|nr:GSCFA domain-containing protein [Saprospiraceae bacterium]
MNVFRTAMIPIRSEFELNHHSNVVIIGSCFAQEIGKKLLDYKFDVRLSPFGIVFNPLSIFHQLNRMVENSGYKESDLIMENELYHSFDHHGSYSSVSSELILQRINSELNESHHFLKSSDFLIITVGSSFYFQFDSLHKIVSNCHKIANNKFSKLLADYEVLEMAAKTCIEKILKFNPKLRIIFTVSPVRYWKDGLIENNRSKARLFYLVDKLLEQYSQIHYFPAYELLIDDLRDYRFFKEDMVHPNDQAIQYIWEFFSNVYFSEQTKYINSKIGEINTLKNHRLIQNSASIEQKHQNKIQLLQQKLMDEFPELKNIRAN